MPPIGPIHGVAIAGTGLALPPRQVRNREVLEILFGTSDEAAIAAALGSMSLSEPMLERTFGFSTRHWTHTIGSPADHTELTSLDLAVRAASDALAEAGVAPGELGGLIVASSTGPRASVCTACHVAGALGATGFAFDIKAGCSSGLYAMMLGASLLQTGLRSVLVVGAEAWSKLIGRRVPSFALAAGDGAAAVVLKRGEGAILGASLGSDGRHAGALMVPGLYPPTPEAIAAGEYELAGDLEGVSGEIRALYPKAVSEALSVAGLAADAIDVFLPHQPSLSIIRRALKDSGIPRKKAHVNVHKYGNMGGASILSALHEARRDGLMSRGSTVGMAVVGGGLTYASAILKV